MCIASGDPRSHPCLHPSVPSPPEGRGGTGGSQVLRTCLRHAPTPLAASGLDMRVGHPAASMAGQIFSQARFSRLGAALATRDQTNVLTRISNRPVMRSLARRTHALVGEMVPSKRLTSGARGSTARPEACGRPRVFSFQRFVPRPRKPELRILAFGNCLAQGGKAGLERPNATGRNLGQCRSFNNNN